MPSDGLVNAFETAEVAVIALCLFVVGMKVDTSKLHRAMTPSRERSSDFVAFCATIVTVSTAGPLIGAAILKLFRVPALQSLGIFVACCTPGGSFTNIMALPAGANVELTAALTLAEIALSFVLMPVYFAALLPSLAPDKTARLPIVQLLFTVALTVALPLCAGILAGRWAKERWAKGRLWLRRIVFTVTITFIVAETAVVGFPPVPPITWPAAATIVVLSLGTILCVGRALRQSTPNLVTMSLEMVFKDGAMAAGVILSGFRHTLSEKDCLAAAMASSSLFLILLPAILVLVVSKHLALRRHATKGVPAWEGGGDALLGSASGEPATQESGAVGVPPPAGSNAA
jgi:predicted Na+-dependent transporter